MARDAVAEIDGPGKACGLAISVIRKAGEETSDTANGDAYRQRDGIEISGGGSESDAAFYDFHEREAEDQRSDDGLAAEKIRGVVKMLKGLLRVFEPE